MFCFRSFAGLPASKVCRVTKDLLTKAFAATMQPSGMHKFFNTTARQPNQTLFPIEISPTQEKVSFVIVFITECQSVSRIRVSQDTSTLLPIVIWLSQIMVVLAVLIKPSPIVSIPIFVTQSLLPVPKFTFPFNINLPPI